MQSLYMHCRFLTTQYLSYTVLSYIQCVQKKETKMFFVISSTKLGRF